MPHLVLVVPCYNEAARLDGDAFVRFRANGHWVEFLFVNDGSSDGTLALLERLRCTSPDTIRVRDQQPNQGKAEAVRGGMLEAMDRGADYIGFWDADLSTPLAAIPEFLSAFDENPHLAMVFGSRVKLLGRHVERRPWRHYLGRVFATMVSAMLRLPIYDTQCGAKIFRSSDELRDVLGERFATSWLFDVEILARFIERAPGGTGEVERSVYELPLREWRDVEGSKLTRAAYVRAAASLGKLYARYGWRLAARGG